MALITVADLEYNFFDVLLRRIPGLKIARHLDALEGWVFEYQGRVEKVDLYRAMFGVNPHEQILREIAIALRKLLMPEDFRLIEPEILAIRTELEAPRMMTGDPGIVDVEVIEEVSNEDSNRISISSADDHPGRRLGLAD